MPAPPLERRRIVSVDREQERRLHRRSFRRLDPWRRVLDRDGVGCLRLQDVFGTAALGPLELAVLAPFPLIVCGAD